MVTHEGEQILRLLREGDGSLLLVAAIDSGTHVTVTGKQLGDDRDSKRAYVDTVHDLADAGLLEQTSEQVFELTSRGTSLADALAKETDAESQFPDTCVLKIGGNQYKAMYLGVHLGDFSAGQSPGVPSVPIGTGLYPGRAGFFRVEGGGEARTLGVLLGFHRFGLLEQMKNVPADDLNRLFKRPGLRAVRDCLLGKQTPDRNGCLVYPKEAPYDAQSIDEFVEASDDPPATVLADCERDTLSLLYHARQERKPVGVTAAEIALWPGKSRFYSVRRHIRATLDDLEEKGLIRSTDSVHYEIEIRRLPEIRRVMAGLLSDQLFDADPPAQQAAYVPESTNKFDAFLCHASEDKDAIVAPFAEAMEQAGLKPWWDRGQIRWGDNLIAKVQEGLSRSRYVVLFFSNAFLGKPWPETELNTAMSMEIGGRTLVLPVLLGLTHEEPKARYPMVSAKLYQVAPDYVPGIAVDQAFIAKLLRDLKSLLDSR